MMFKIKGIFKVRSKGRTYFYAWRGGPPLRGKPGSPEFLASYNEAIEDRSASDPSRFRSVVTRYKASKDYEKLSDSTKEEWSKWLDRISEYFGDLRIAQFDRPKKIRPIIRKWRNRWASTPRTADYGKQVLSRVCSFAVDPLGEIETNPCDGIKNLYSVDRSEVIWTDADIAVIEKTCAIDLSHAIDLAAVSGLREGDLIRLSWSHIGEDAIVLSTGKSRGRKEVIIPLYDELRAVLARIPKRSTTVLTNSRSRPWTQNGLVTAMGRAKRRAKIVGLKFHDLRGTAATRFYNAGIEVRVIAEILGWDEESVHKIIRRYVGRAAATKALIKKLREAKQ